MRKIILNIATIAMLFAAASCSKPDDVQPQASANNSQSNSTGAKVAPIIKGIPNTLAYYDTIFYTINLMEKVNNAAILILHNKGVNDIYVSQDLSDDFNPTYLPVLSAIPHDGMNALWHQYIIQFNPGHTPHQFFKDDDVNAAVAANEITLIDTGEVYRCSVVSHKPAM